MKLTRPLALFDLETTGTNTQQDKIVSIAVIKILPDGSKEQKTMLIDPGIPIPPQATEVHGITDQMVQGKPKFINISKSLKDFLNGSDIGGYNSDEFDLQMLIQEFHRCQIEFPDWELNLVDAFKIERKLNPHTLGDTYKRYTGKDLEGAHDAMEDTIATELVLECQVSRLVELMEGEEITVEFLDKFAQGENTRFDYAGKAYVKEGVVYWSFGKNRDKDVLKDRSYLNWVLNSDFPIQTKKKLKGVLLTNGLLTIGEVEVLKMAKSGKEFHGFGGGFENLCELGFLNGDLEITNLGRDYVNEYL